MQKIPTLFERDWDGDRSRVIDTVNPAAQWVADGEGVATRKYDGTACLVRGGRLYRRHAAVVPEGAVIMTATYKPIVDVRRVVMIGSDPTIKKEGSIPYVPAGSGVIHRKEPALGLPEGFDPVAIETSPGRKGPVSKAVGWVPVGAGPEDRWHREAFTRRTVDAPDGTTVDAPDGTYELLGPKIQANPEGLAVHVLYRHADAERFPDAPRDFAALAAWLDGRDIEGLVWHHPDGRMAKIKLRDFGLRRPSAGR